MDINEVLVVISAHIPSLTEEADIEIAKILDRWWLETTDTADLAIRYCRCSVRIDGFYEYVDHLKTVLRKELA